MYFYLFSTLLFTSLSGSHIYCLNPSSSFPLFYTHIKFPKNTAARYKKFPPSFWCIFLNKLYHMPRHFILSFPLYVQRTHLIDFTFQSRFSFSLHRHAVLVLKL
uniref:Secreted protein n=1 Tax=Cacopsylla melanoneura TaxID=428564 RepID=A0A8D8QEU7_9HEMI